MRQIVNFTSYGNLTSYGVNVTSRVNSRAKDIPTPFLGGGYSDDKQMAAELACYKPGNVTFSGSGKSTVYFSNAVSFTDLQQTLNVDVSASLKIGLFSAGVSASYLKEVEAKHYQEAIYYSETVSLPTQQWQPFHYGIDALSDLGTGVYGQGSAQFRSVCGNEIVQEIETGATLVATLLLDFASYYEKTVFTQHVSASWGSLFSASVTITRIVTQYKLTGTLKFLAYQDGGNATQLAKIFNTGPSGYYVARCSLTNLDACKSVIDGVISYAQNDFPIQINFNGTVIGSVAPISYTWLDASDLGLNTSVTVVTPAVTAARKMLGDLYKDQTANSTFVNHLLGSPFATHMYDSAITHLRINQNILDNNLPLLDDETNGAIGCYFYPANCPAIAQTLLTQLQPVDTKFINGMNTGWIVSGDLSYCTCTGGCGGVKASIDTLLFPADNSTLTYISTIAPTIVASVMTTSSTLALDVSDGSVCHTAYKDTAYNRYNLNPCVPADQNIGCVVPLGGHEDGWLCASEVCAGLFVFQPMYNPL